MRTATASDLTSNSLLRHKKTLAYLTVFKHEGGGPALCKHENHPGALFAVHHHEAGSYDFVSDNADNHFENMDHDVELQRLVNRVERNIITPNEFHRSFVVRLIDSALPEGKQVHLSYDTQIGWMIDFDGRPPTNIEFREVHAVHKHLIKPDQQD